jgi:GT2 family glycosyltransferase
VATGLRDHDYITWLNDDDLLEPESLTQSVSALVAVPEAVVAFGWCRYIDDDGRQLWVSRAGAWAPRILGWGPDLIPQPGMLVRSPAWVRAGGLDTSYRLAFDLDLLLRLREQGPFINVDAILSSFRWHPSSLTVEDRTLNIRESERAKRTAMGPIARKFTWAWQRPVRVATTLAAARLNRQVAHTSAPNA